MLLLEKKDDMIMLCGKDVNISKVVMMEKNSVTFLLIINNKQEIKVLVM